MAQQKKVYSWGQVNLKEGLNRARDKELKLILEILLKYFPEAKIKEAIEEIKIVEQVELF